MMDDFWVGKVPCWDVMDCPDLVRDSCPAYEDRSCPCWEIPDTACDRILGTPKTCDVCQVYKLYA